MLPTLSWFLAIQCAIKSNRNAIKRKAKDIPGAAQAFSKTLPFCKVWSSGDHLKCSPQNPTVCTHQESSGFQMKGKLPNPSKRGALIPALPSLITLPRKHLQPRRAHFTEKINGWEGSGPIQEQSSANGQNQPKLWLSHHQEWGIFSILASNGKRFKLPIHVHVTWA